MTEVSERRVRLGIVRGVSYGLFAAPDEFMPQVRALGAGLARVYVYWAQVEPRRGEFDWRVVDAVTGQLAEHDEMWVTVCSSSPWGTRVPTDFQPPSPAVDDEAYERFVTALVERFAGRVRYWQCNNEPSNTGLTWSGSADEYVHQARIFARALRRADPAALVVLGGCGYDMLSSPAGSPPRAFFDTVVRDAQDSFDLFSIHLYDNPYRIPEHVETVRELMAAHGYERPVVVGEYNGPTLFDFPAANAALEQTMAASFTAAQGSGGDAVSMSTADLAAQLVDETPDRRALRQLYQQRDQMPRALRMFMHDAPAELAGLRDRVACRQLVQRALLALSLGIDTLACWNLAPEVGGYTDPFNIMDLMFGTLALMDYQDGRIATVHPEGRTHRLMASVLRGADHVERLPVEAVDAASEVYAFRIHSGDGGWQLAAWTRGGDVLDEDQPPVPVRFDWPYAQAHAVDVFGCTRSVKLDAVAGTVECDLAGTPVFVSSVARESPAAGEGASPGPLEGW